MTLTPRAQLYLIEQIITLVRQNYIFPEKATAISNSLRNCFNEGEFDSTSYARFADKLTAVLQASSEDKHFRVSAIDKPERECSEEDFIGHWFRVSDWVRTSDYGFRSVQVLENNVGYINLQAFFPKDIASPRADAAMKIIENTRAVIVDLRENGGGKPDMVQYLCSYFFDERMILNSLFWRKGNTTEDFWVIDEVNGKKRPDTELFVLTSNKTFSAAEEFAYNMQSRKRATIIGETTGGGGNPGEVFEVAGVLEVFISTGRAVNPVTQTSWEGVGVKPDIEIAADKALNTALKLCAEVVECSQVQSKIWFATGAEKLLECLTKANKLLESGQPQEGKSLVKAAVNQAKVELNFTLRDFEWLAGEYRTRFGSSTMADLLVQVVDE